MGGLAYEPFKGSGGGAGVMVEGKMNPCSLGSTIVNEGSSSPAITQNV